MTTLNPFDLLGDDDNDDPTHLIAKQQQKIIAMKANAAPPAPVKPPAKLPVKPIPPSQAVKEARNDDGDGPRGGGRIGGGGGRGRGGRGGGSGGNRDFGSNGNDNGFSSGYGGGGGGGGRGGRGRGGRGGGNRDFGSNENENENENGNENGYGGGGGGEDGGVNKPSERERGGYRAPRQLFRGDRRHGFGDGEVGGDSERPSRRQFDRHSGTNRGRFGIKREGAGRGNWGTPIDAVVEQEPEEIANAEDKILTPEKQPEQEDVPALDANKEIKESPVNETEEKEPEDKEMTLEEYQKVLEEKRKSLLAMKAEERKVEFDKEFESMQQLSIKKGNDDIFIKLGSDKDLAKRKENAEREERVKKSLSINEFLKPAEGGRSYSPGGRGRGRGRGDRGDRGQFRGGFHGGSTSSPAAPSIEDPGQFPTLGGK
ncbi:RGG repeats nuclear RNA binding protein A-like [Tasmannia lanceolata]|uniref:RGG repeats nuclear RNA binding protein A-like n=1 Tax=Tasmannia lanceolata TaxID=3420 RepID=UPI0040643D8C